MFQQVRYAIRQCARLTRSRARKHQKRPFKRFRREPSDDRKPVFRSTILPPDASMLKGSRIRELSEEICSIINIFLCIFQIRFFHKSFYSKTAIKDI